MSMPMINATAQVVEWKKPELDLWVVIEYRSDIGKWRLWQSYESQAEAMAEMRRAGRHEQRLAHITSKPDNRDARIKALRDALRLIAGETNEHSETPELDICAIADNAIDLDDSDAGAELAK